MGYWQQRVVLVTGGSGGLGREIARAFGEAGARVVIAARDEHKLAAAVEELSVGDRQVVGIPADVTAANDVDALLAEVRRRFDRLDVLVNNVGRSVRQPIAETSTEDVRDLMAINFLAVVRCTHAALDSLLSTGGHVVNIGSLAAKAVSPHLGAYPATKFALAAYSAQLRQELGPQGLHVLLVCPGPLQRDDAGHRYNEQTSEMPDAARQAGAGVKLGAISPAWLARKIVSACERRRAEIVVPWRSRWLFALSQLSPRWGDWVVEKMIRK